MLKSLRGFYFLRALFAFVWVALVFAFAPGNPNLGFVLLVLYPAWDGVANLLDAMRTGRGASSGQRANAAVSFLVACAIGAAGIGGSIAAAVGVFGFWAFSAGALQLAVGVGRRKAGGQVFMMISGLQSALAGGFFIFQALTQPPVSIVRLAPYAAFGGFYFLLSAIWLTVKPAKADIAA